MTLTPGTRIGSCEVLAPLGAGGMGEVYRARDSKLNRDVALKVLPAALATDPDRLARFTREAQTLAALNHPNIAAIYGVEESPSTGSGQAGVRALVMELVAGDDLAKVIARGPIPLAEALPIARQIAEALEAAHELGIIHRDLKPANIKVRDDGTVKVLDFGLAKALGPEVPSATADAMNSPTITTPAMTAAGVILGTAAYMAPEQARGKAVDKRADIWAFGVVLYEMLTGTRLFDGESVAETLGLIFAHEPDLAKLPEATPTGVRALITRCLVKNPRERLRDIGDARLELSEPQKSGTFVPTPAAVGTGLWRRIALGLGTMLVGVGLAVAAGWLKDGPEAGADVRFTVTPPGPGGRIVVLRVARDGRRLVYSLSSERRLLVHDLDQFDSRAIAGTEDASRPFLSPDGRWIGFYQGGKIRKVAFDGGDPTNVCDANDDTPGAAWGESGVILFSRAWTNTGLWQVSASGGQPTEVTTPDRGKGETGHFWPDFLPDGRAALFTIWGGWGLADAKVGLFDLESQRYDVLFDGAAPQYVESGHVLYYRGGAYRAVPFDVTRRQVTGPEVSVLPYVRRLDPVGSEGNYAAFASTGAFVYVEGDSTLAAPLSRLAWLSRDGRLEELPFEGYHANPSLSPDGTRVAVNRVEHGQHQVFVYDLKRGTAEQLTRDGQNWRPTWSPDGRRIAVTSQTSGHFDVRSMPADGTLQAEPLVATKIDEGNWQWAPDGKSAVFTVWSPVSGMDIWRALGDGREPAPLLASPRLEGEAVFSPDGKWLAYSSGRALYVAPYPSLGQRVLIAPITSGTPRWSRSTPELFYVESGRLKAVTYTSRAGAFQPAPARTLFELGRLGTDFDVAPDGRRFLFLAGTTGQPDRDVVRVVLNGFDELRGGTR
jgi:eukaryotic-like serine/threonine-protein kinase